MPEFNDAPQVNSQTNSVEKPATKKSSAKMKSTTTKGDAIDKGKTITGSKPDTIEINPQLQRNEARVFQEIAKIYDKIVGESINSAGGGTIRGLGYVSGSGDNDNSDPYIDANVANADTRDNIMAGHVQDHSDLHAPGVTATITKASATPTADPDRELDKGSHSSVTQKLAVNGVSDQVRASKAGAAVKEAIDITNTHNREIGTDSLTQIYKAFTPGQGVDMDFAFRFADPKKDKEAVTRTGQPRKKMDLVPRMDPDRNRKTDSDFYRQQSIVKKVVDETFNEAFGKSKTQGKDYKSPWDKIEKAKPGIGKRIDTAIAGLKQNAKDYEAVVNKEKTNEDTIISELTKKFTTNFISRMIDKHPDTMKSNPIGKDVKRKKALDLALDKLKPLSAIHKPHVVATEETVNEVSPELIGKVHRRHEIEGVPYKSKVAYNVVKNAVRKAAGVKKPEPYVLPDVDKVPPGIGMKEDATSEKDPLAHLEDRLNKAGDTSHNAIDKIMRDVANDYDMKVQDLHDKWVAKYKITPDQYCKEDKEVWDKPNPKKNHGHMTLAQIAQAKARAKAAGRPYPNLIDNIAVKREKK